MFKAKIHFNSILVPDMDAFVERILCYQYMETGSYLEVFMENPKVRNASALDEDIREALKPELRNQGINLSEHSLRINYYESQ